MIGLLRPFLFLIALAIASEAHASSMVQTPARAEIVAAAGIALTQDLSFRAQLPSTSMIISSGGRARIRLTGNTVSLATPSFNLIRDGGLETLTVIIRNAIIQDDEDRATVLGGALRANGALSVDVSGTVALMGRTMQPGAYRGLLVVVAQYN
jgi:hypothetical protein